jgi:hypothetical protein
VGLPDSFGSVFRQPNNELPSAVTKDISTGPFEFSEEEISERMSGNLCLCVAKWHRQKDLSNDLSARSSETQPERLRRIGHGVLKRWLLH